MKFIIIKVIYFRIYNSCKKSFIKIRKKHLDFKNHSFYSSYIKYILSAVFDHCIRSTNCKDRLLEIYCILDTIAYMIEMLS